MIVEPVAEQIPACGPLCLTGRHRLGEKRWHDGWQMPLPAVHDEEGPRLPESLPPVVDAHVHLFPDRMHEAIWSWFEKFGWPIRYKLKAKQVIRFQLDRGVAHLVALHYAHKDGVARKLNQFMAELLRDEPQVTGVATVMPGEPDAAKILEEGFDLGLRGVKLHCHVQMFAPDDPKLHEIYEVCSRRGMPLVMHSGREPSSPAYPVDVYTLCSAERTEAVLRSFPKLKLCVPHLGADEFDAHAALLERYDNLWLDTTMAVANYFPGEIPWRVVEARPERILYGTDFPHLPYAWDREVKNLAARLRDQPLQQILGGTARALFGI